ncbi:MAG TPA: lysylphosphatidylglycerol synthase transmembrane domain-containing protein [Gaiellaceae bacterium]|nr:lysylphosphatidylglycerol synthase transmembrane domain-containing protein [Gaiellaceae bacterium]
MSRAAEGLRLDRRALLVGVGVAVLLGLGTIGLLGAAADFDALWQAVRAADHVWLPLCLAGLVAAYAGYILGYREVARMHGGPSLPFGTVTRVVAIGFGANVLGSAAGGLAVDFWALHRAGASVRDAARRVLGFNTLEWALLGTFAAVAALLVLAGRGEGAPLAMTLPWLVGVPLCVGAAAWVSSPRRVGRFTRVAESEPAREGRDARGWLRWARIKAKKLLADAIGGVVVARHLLTHPRSHAAGVLGFAVYWAGHLVTLWAALRAFAGTAELTLAALVLAFATGYAASALPLPAGGSGGIEAALTFSLHGVGMPLAPALLGVLVYRFFTFWLPLVPALLLLPTAPRLNRDLAGVRDSRGAA